MTTTTEYLARVCETAQQTFPLCDVWFHGPTIFSVDVVDPDLLGRVMVAYAHNVSGWEAVFEDPQDEQHPLFDGPGPHAPVEDVMRWVADLLADIPGSLA